jgi:Ca-activated chloride channel homolog
VAREHNCCFNTVEHVPIEHGAKTMIDQLQQFHFLRPLWLLGLLPTAALTLALWRMPSSGANWRRTIAPELLDHLLDAHVEQRKRWPWLMLLTWIIAVLALAGPAWEKLPQPVLQKRDALVVVLDLSLSMYAEDIKPSRLQRARFKIIDILKRRDEGLTGLVAYSGDAHVVSPLTDDTATIANLVPALAPDMMPSYGSDPVAGIEQAIQLLRNAGFERGRIFLLSDEITEANIDAIAKLIGGGWQLSVLGIGTEQGAPIPLSNQGKSNSFLKQRNGEIVVAQLHRQRFTQLAQRSGGRYSDLRADDKDLDALLPQTQIGDETRSVQREFDQWRERGAWLAILLLPFAALAFRRGWLLLLLLLPMSPPSHAQAPAIPQTAPSTLQQKDVQQTEAQQAPQTDWRENISEQWRNLWQRPDQQAQQAMNAGDVKAAAEKFRDPAWRGAALYRAGDYAAAAQALQNIDNADADYNRGNALARAGKLLEALAAYDAALKKKPDLDDAKTNRELIEKLLQQQKQQQQNNPSDKNRDNDDKKSNQNNEQQSSQQQSGDKNQQSDNGDNKQSPNGEPQNKNPADNNANNQSDAQNNADAPAKEQPPSKAPDEPSSTADKKASDQQAAQQQTAESVKGHAEEQAKDEQQNTASATQQEENKDQLQLQAQQQRATDQWLRQIPDDPAGLLRRKFLYEHRQRERAPARDDEQPLW